MTNPAQTQKVLRLRGSATRKARVALAATFVAAALVLPSLAAGLVAPPAHASTTFTVNSTSDIGDPNPNDGQCVIPDFSGVDHCSLRAAIQNANGTPGADVINFAIPSGQSTTITPGTFGSTPLPVITEQVTINGYSQEGSSPNTRAVGDDAVIKVELDGSTAGSGAGLKIQDAKNSVIRGLAINHFLVGISVFGATSFGNRVEGNFIGTDPTGTLHEENIVGVVVNKGASGNVVGWSTPDKRNLISGNLEQGIFLGGESDAGNNLLQGNYIGTDKSGTKAIANLSDGVVVNNTQDTTVSGNVISGNSDSGLLISGGTHGTKAFANRIGTTASGSAPLGNLSSGVLFTDFASDNQIGDGTAAGSNTIAFNGDDGVEVDSGTGNKVSRNSIFSNAGLGIDLGISGPTANDALDGDSGANHLQNKPSVGSARTSSTGTNVKGTLRSAPNQTFTVRLYVNPAGGDEGKRFLGQFSVSTGGKGNASFTKALPK